MQSTKDTKDTKDTKGCGSGALSGVPTDLPAAPNGSPHLRVRAGLEASPFRAFRVFRGLFICIAPAKADRIGRAVEQGVSSNPRWRKETSCP